MWLHAAPALSAQVVAPVWLGSFQNGRNLREVLSVSAMAIPNLVERSSAISCVPCHDELPVKMCRALEAALEVVVHVEFT